MAAEEGVRDDHEAAQYRLEAARARRSAEQAVAAESRRAFAEIADRYERLARWAERYGSTKP